MRRPTRGGGVSLLRNAGFHFVNPATHYWWSLPFYRNFTQVNHLSRFYLNNYLAPLIIYNIQRQPSTNVCSHQIVSGLHIFKEKNAIRYVQAH